MTRRGPRRLTEREKVMIANAIVHASGEQLAARADAGYLAHGRGAVCIRIPYRLARVGLRLKPGEFITAQGIEMGFFTPDALGKMDGPHERHLIATYNPEWEYVTIWTFWQPGGYGDLYTARAPKISQSVN